MEDDIIPGFEDIDNPIPGFEDIEESNLNVKPGAINKPENILQKVARTIQSIDPQGMAYSMTGGAMPGELGATAGSKMMGGPSMMNTGTRAESMRQRGTGGNIFLDILSDPMTYVGGKAVTGEASNLGKKAFPYASKEARVRFTKGVEKKLISRRNALTRSYGKSLENSKAMVDISPIVDEGSEITKLTMKEAQDLKNAITMGIPEGVKRGLKISPKHFQNRETAGILTNLMKEADPKMAQIMEKYGKHSENFKEAISPIASQYGSESIFGGNLFKKLTRQGTMPEKSEVALKEFAPRVAKDVSKASLNENIFRGVRGAAIGTAIWPLVPNVIKRAVASNIT